MLPLEAYKDLFFIFNILERIVQRFPPRMLESATEARESAARSARRATAPRDKRINPLLHSVPRNSVNWVSALPEAPVAEQLVTVRRRLERTTAFARHLLVIMALSPFWLMLAAIALSLQALHHFGSVVFDEDT